jgi:hypothetical protein
MGQAVRVRVHVARVRAILRGGDREGCDKDKEQRDEEEGHLDALVSLGFDAWLI